MLLLGRKIGMTQAVAEDGRAVPVTLVQAGPCRILRIKTPETDGYRALQIGFEENPRRLASRAERGQVAGLDLSPRSRARRKNADASLRLGCEPPRIVREIRLSDEQSDYAAGSLLTVELFANKKYVDVVGLSKGRGFTGAMKRHNFSGQCASHGVKQVHRHPGSTGQNTDPSRVFKGAKMSGRYGCERVTVRNLALFSIDHSKNLLLIRGAVPGPNGGLLVVRFPKEPPRSAL